MKWLSAAVVGALIAPAFVQAQTIKADERGKPYGLLPISLPLSVRDWLYF
jgi:hypothetical protein